MAKRRNNRKQANLIAQGGIMAVVLLLVNACMVFRQIPLTVMWGDKGNSIYAASYGIFSFACLLSSYGLSAAVSGLLKPRLKQGQYKNAGRIMQAALLYATVTGAALGAALFLGAAYVTGNILSEPLGALPLQVLSVSVLLYAWNGVLRGYFLGNGAAFPVAVSMAAEQLVTLAAGLLFAGARQEYGEKAGALLLNGDFAYCFAAQGFAAGIFAGAAFSFVLLLLIYLTSHSYYKKRNGKDSGRGKEGMGQAISIVSACLLPAVFYGLCVRGYLFMQQICFRQFMKDSMGADLISGQWGMYYGKYKIFTALPVILAAAMSSTVRERVYACHRKDDYPYMRSLIQNVLQAVMVVVIPLAVMTGTLAVPLLDTLFPGQDTEAASALLLTGFITSVFFAAAYVLAETLRGLRKMPVLLFCAVLSLAVHGGSLYGLLEALHLDISGVLYADMIYAFCLLVFVGAAAQRYCRFRYGLLRGSIPPVAAAAVMGAVLFLLTKALGEAMPPGALLALGAAAGTVIYFTVLLVLRGVTEKQLLLIPGGKWIRTAAKALRLL